MSVHHRVLLTGATGHVGGRLLRQLLSDPTISTRALLRTSIDLPEWSGGAKIVVGDIREASTRVKALHEIDVVIHATRGFPANIEPSREQIEDERSTTKAFLQESIKLGVRRFIFLSSIHVYGASLSGLVHEEVPCQPLSTYGISRKIIEDDVLAASADSGMETAVVRLSNSFGAPGFPRDDVWHLVVHDLCRQVVQSQSISLRSDPRTCRDIIAMRDATNILVQMVQSSQNLRGVFHLASGQTIQIQELAQLVGNIAQNLYGFQVPIKSLQTDSIAPPTFTLDLKRLHRYGIRITNNRDNEIQDLLAYTRTVFGLSRQ